MDESKLHETGCSLCGVAPSEKPYTFGTPYQVCLVCSERYGGNAHAELNRRLSLRSAPAPEFKVGDWVEWELGGRNVGILVVGVSSTQWKVSRVPRDSRDRGDIRDVFDRELRPWQPLPGEMCEGIALNGFESVRGEFERLGNLGYPILGGRSVTEESLRPASPAQASPPPEARESCDAMCALCGKAMFRRDWYQNPARNQYGTCRECHFKDTDAKPKAVGVHSCARCGAACHLPGDVCDACCAALGWERGKKAVVSDPYRTHVNAVPDGSIAAVMAEQDLRYRKRVKELRLDMDRELPRTWRDKMGRLVSFDGPVGKGDKR